VTRLAGELDGAAVTALHKASRPGDPIMVLGDVRVLPPVDLARREGRGHRVESELYVATPAVLRYLGIEPATVDPDADFLVDRSARIDGLSIVSPAVRRDLAITKVQRIEVGQHLFGTNSALTPPKFVTLAGLQRHGWKQIPAGWLVESSTPLTSDEIANARDIAADAGLALEVQREDESLTTVMAIATAAGAVLALAILAMTVGLIRSESAGDLRTLTAAGATSGIRRTLTAVTAGALALLGALLAVAGAYVVLAAIYHDDLGYLSDVPLLYLGLAVLGVPVAAAAAGWLLAGREPPAVARAVIE
jgi:putative ABC transport system permease protein